MSIDCTVRFETSKELGQFADFWDNLVRSRGDQPASDDPEERLRLEMRAESEAEAKKAEKPKAKKAEKPKAEKDPTGDPVCTPQEFVEAVRKWHAQDPSTRTALIQRELDVLGIEKLQAIQPKDYPGFLTELGISK